MKVNWKEFQRKLALYRAAYPRQREGQAFFNVLYDVAPQVADKLRGTENDPFYVSSRVDRAINTVEWEW